MAVVKSWFRAAISRLVLCCCLAVAGNAAAAEPAAVHSAGAVAALQAKLAAQNGVTATFEQQITNAKGYVTESSAGELFLDKPRIRWEVAEPYPQVVIVEESLVRVYDPDLEQVTERDLNDAWQEVPLTLLTHDEVDLAKFFDVNAEPAEAPLQRFVLRPKSTDALFSRVEIVFLNDALYALLIFDHAHQQTVIRFGNYRSGQMIESDVFDLDLPPDTDVVRG